MKWLAGTVIFRSSLFDPLISSVSFFNCFGKFFFHSAPFFRMNLSPGDSNYSLIVGRETLDSRCSLCSLSNTKDSLFFLAGDLHFSEGEGNLVCGLSRTGVLRQLAIFKISL